MLHVFVALDKAHGKVFAVVYGGAELAAIAAGKDLGEGFGLAHQVGAGGSDACQLQTLHALQDDRSGLVGHLEDTYHTGGGTGLIEVFQHGIFGLGGALAEDADGAFLLEGVLDEAQ